MKDQKPSMMHRPKIAEAVIIGRGPWGQALASLLKPKLSKVSSLDENSTPQEWTEAFSNPSLVVLACPFKSLSDVLKRIRNEKLWGVVNASKGIDQKTLLSFTGLAKKHLRCPHGSLSGPTFAQEVLEQRPTACVIASQNLRFARQISRLFSSSRFRVYTSTDPIGIEVCGAVKNVLAIACGLSDGMGLGYNSRAALLTRGLNEMQIVVRWLGGKANSVYGLAGVGDLWLTATGDLSRNRQLGLQLAKGADLETALKNLKGTCEGVYTVRQIHQLDRKHRLELPICEQIYKTLFERQAPLEAIQSLMTRELKAESKAQRKKQK